MLLQARGPERIRGLRALPLLPKAAVVAGAVTLQFMFHNFARPHKSLANPYPRTPAMAAGIADHIWTCEEIAALVE